MYESRKKYAYILRVLIFVNCLFFEKMIDVFIFLKLKKLKSFDLFFDKIFETPSIPCGGMILIQETSIKLNIFELFIFSTDNFIITKVVLSMVISII